MNSMDENKNTVLDSHIQLLDHVKFISQLSSNLILLTGAEGAGKTWLVNRYLENYVQDSNSALLVCQSGQTDIQYRTLLLQQFADHPMFNVQDTLCHSVEQMLAGKNGDWTVIIDDAHLLNISMVAELCDLVAYAEQQPNWKINILLFSNPGILEPALNKASQDCGLIPIELEIRDYSANQQDKISDILVVHEPSDKPKRREVTPRIGFGFLRPAILQRFSQHKIEDGLRRPFQLSMMWVLGLLLVLMLGVVLFDFLPRYLEQNENSSAVDVEQSVNMSESMNDTQAIGNDTVYQSDEIIIDSQPLPQQVSNEELAVGFKDEHARRVDVPAHLVDVILQEQEQVAAENSQSSYNISISENIKPDTDVNLPQQAEIVTDNGSALSAMESAKISLRDINPKHYAIQLAAMRSLASAQSFIAKHQVKGIATIYETSNDNQRWFIVVTGNYATLKQAQQAKSQLPSSLKDVQPWIKSYGRIQSEMDRLK